MSATENAGPQSAETTQQASRRHQLRRLAAESRWAALFWGAILTAMLLDWWRTLFDPAARLALTAAAGLTSLIGLVVLVRRARSHWSPRTEVAAEESAALPGPVVPAAVVGTRAARTGLAMLGGVLALWVVAWLADPAQFVVLWRRFWSPLQEISLTQVESSTAGAIIARDEPFTILAQTVNRVRDQATIYLRDVDGHTTQHEMTDGAGQFSFAIAAVDHPCEYRVRSGDGQTPWHRLEVADRPFLTSVEYRITPPADSGRSIVTESVLPQRTQVLAGSTIEIGFIANEPLREAQMVGGDGAALPLERLSDCTFRFYQEVTQDLDFSMRLTNEYGLTNERSPQFQIVVDGVQSGVDSSGEQ